MNGPQEKRKRILFVAEAVTLAHVVRPLVLAQGLDPTRYEVHFACAKGYDFCFKDTNFVYWPIESVSPRKFLVALAKGARLYDEKTLVAYVESDLKLLDEIRPDLVVGDFRLSLAVSAPLRKIPYAAITNAHWSPFSTIRHPPIPEHPLVKLVGVVIATALFRLVYPAVFAFHSRPVNRLRQKHGLAPLGGLRHVYTHGDYTLYADVPGLVSTGGLPANHFYLGPILWSPPTPRPDWWDAFPDDAPCVYVTLGSSGQLDVLPLLLEVLADLPVVVMVATAGRKNIAAVPGRVWVADFLPGLEAARHSSLVICNGGSATVYQALSAGVPVLGLVANMDQYLTMGCVQDAGAGKLIRTGMVTVAGLREGIMELLVNNRYRDSAERIAQECRKYGAQERFVELAKSWLG